ncbi:BMP family ABC transporter substrate-binding protein [Vibrionales bacterium C3R12]|nr:BMP family ABC transporter substrate-binding protein [Vibrionales bacterium C3R12]
MAKKILGLIAALLTSHALAAHDELKPLVLFQGKLDEGTYLHMIDRGITRFEEVSLIPVTRKRLERDNEAYLSELRKNAEQGYSPIIVQDANSLEHFDQVANNYPSTRFISLDVAFDVPNILGLTFNHAEGAYVIGYAAGLKTTTNKVGFIGGLDIPVIENFRCGYELGLKKANPTATLSTDYINTGAFSWDDSATAKRLAETMTSNDVDVIFPVAGFASQAVMETMKNTEGGYSFGIDYDYSSKYPNTVVASLEKRADRAIFAALMLLKNDIWNSNEKRFGIKQGIINIIINKNNSNLSDDEKEQINDVLVKLKGKNNSVTREISTLCQI